MKHSFTNRTFEFRNHVTGQILRIEAVDGHNAWIALRALHGPGDYRQWSILTCCYRCGKASGYAYCSQVCHDLSWTKLKGELA